MFKQSKSENESGFEIRLLFGRVFVCALFGAVSAASADGITFSGGWENGLLLGQGNWKSAQVVAGDRLQLVTDPVRQGRYSLRVEVRPGDDPIHSSGERAEVLVMTDANGSPINESEASGTQYFAFSVRLDAGWQPPVPEKNGNWAVVFQLHGPDELKTGPSFAVSVLDHFNIAIHAGDLDSPAKSLQWKSYEFSDSGLTPGKWVDLVLRIKFAKDFTGSVTVWRRNEGQGGFAQVLLLEDIPTLQYRSSLGPVGAHYWKHGLYRSKQATITNVLWLDGLTRGESFDEVVGAAFSAR